MMELDLPPAAALLCKKELVSRTMKALQRSKEQDLPPGSRTKALQNPHHSAESKCIHMQYVKTGLAYQLQTQKWLWKPKSIQDGLCMEKSVF